GLAEEVPGQRGAVGPCVGRGSGIGSMEAHSGEQFGADVKAVTVLATNTVATLTTVGPTHDDMVTGFNFSHARADCLDHSRSFVPQDPGQRQWHIPGLRV